MGLPLLCGFLCLLFLVSGALLGPVNGEQFFTTIECPAQGGRDACAGASKATFRRRLRCARQARVIARHKRTAAFEAFIANPVTRAPRSSSTPLWDCRAASNPSENREYLAGAAVAKPLDPRLRAHYRRCGGRPVERFPSARYASIERRPCSEILT